MTTMHVSMRGSAIVNACMHLCHRCGIVSVDQLGEAGWGCSSAYDAYVENNIFCPGTVFTELSICLMLTRDECVRDARCGLLPINITEYALVGFTARQAASGGYSDTLGWCTHRDTDTSSYEGFMAWWVPWAHAA